MSDSKNLGQVHLYKHATLAPSQPHMECIKQAINEFEWRLNFEAELSK